jgi:hypothetical protein
MNEADSGCEAQIVKIGLVELPPNVQSEDRHLFLFRLAT